MKWLDHTLTEYDKATDELAGTDRYKKPGTSSHRVQGIKNIFALVMITEIGNIKRFKPIPVSSHLGWAWMFENTPLAASIVVLGITKHGNRYLRTAFVESNQRVFPIKDHWW